MLDPDLILQTTAHRPWPLPTLPWFMFQEWDDLLFAHWAVDPAIVRRLVPKELELDLHDGKAWISLTPFRMSNVHLRGLPPLPGTNSFLEMNLRTYVRNTHTRSSESHERAAPGHGSRDRETKPGIYFFSLDASNILAVMGARIGFGLPYFWSDMTADVDRAQIRYKSHRRQTLQSVEVEVTYEPQGEVISQKSDLDIFLTERYCLYEVRLGQVFRTDIHHDTWPLQLAHAEFATNTIGEAHGLPLVGKPDLLHFSRQLSVLVYPPIVIWEEETAQSEFG